MFKLLRIVWQEQGRIQTSSVKTKEITEMQHKKISPSLKSAKTSTFNLFAAEIKNRDI